MGWEVWDLQVFLSYRREDSAPWAGRLRDALAARFGEGHVFQDVVTVAPGERFDDTIESALSQCDAAIAVIGPRWITAVDTEGEPRLTSTADYVRRELTIALSRTTPTIPVLVGGAAMPTAEHLPVELRPLLLRQAIALRDETWHDDVERLVRALHGRPVRNPSRSRLLVAGIATIAVLVAGVVMWLTRGDGDRGNESGATTPAVSTVFDAVTASLSGCLTPQPPDWADLGMSDRARSEAVWSFEVVDAFQRVAGADEQDIIVQTRATNLNEGSMTHYPFYALLVAGDRYTPTCFSLIGGSRMVSPQGMSGALVGFTGPREPPGSMALEVDDSGDVYRVDLTATTAG